MSQNTKANMSAIIANAINPPTIGQRINVATGLNLNSQSRHIVKSWLIGTAVGITVSCIMIAVDAAVKR